MEVGRGEGGEMVEGGERERGEYIILKYQVHGHSAASLLLQLKLYSRLEYSYIEILCLA